jgi:preprotein translocase subunit YajC
VSSEDLAGLLPLLVLGVLAYFLFIRPARNRAKNVQKLQNALSPGDEVMLTSGIFATVEEIVDEQIRVEISPGVSVMVHRGAIGKIIRDVPVDDIDDIGESSQYDEHPIEPPATADEQTGDRDDPNARGAN